MSRLFQSFARPRAVPPIPMPVASTPAPHDEPADASGPGWYESSQDLRRGLMVQELIDAETVSDAVAPHC